MQLTTKNVRTWARLAGFRCDALTDGPRQLRWFVDEGAEMLDRASLFRCDHCQRVFTRQDDMFLDPHAGEDYTEFCQNCGEDVDWADGY